MGNILLISGKAEHGKDTFANLFKKHKEQTKIFHFADDLKRIASDSNEIAKLLKYGFYRRAERKSTKSLDIFVNFMFYEYKKNKSQKLWDGKKDDLGRRYLQLLGDACKETFGDTVFAESTLKRILKSKADFFLIPDTRFPCEITHFKENAVNHKVITIRIIRPNFDNGLGENGKHRSEIALDDYKFDYTIINDGRILDLENKVKDFIEVSFK